ncbi:MAG TPA: hypothetical protein VMT76_18450 [Puia sp.]|nr:hypothetical protein [Puia sp.]
MATKKTVSKKINESAEHIRIAPLHYPKPQVQLSELGKDTEDSELFQGHPHAIPSSAHLTYYGGPLLTNVKVYTIFWGKNWAGIASYIKLKDKINAFFKTILVSPLIDQLHEYSVPGKTIGHGSLIGTKVITAAAPGSSITDTAIKARIKSWISAHTIPVPGSNTLYFVYTDINVKVIMGGGGSCTSFCGYHNDISKKIFYAVMPFPSCSGCLGGLSVFDALTGTSSHELCEAITDPIPGKGWYDAANGEIGDICAWTFKTVSGYKVQKEWSNAANACI